MKFTFVGDIIMSNLVIDFKLQLLEYLYFLRLYYGVKNMKCELSSRYWS